MHDLKTVRETEYIIQNNELVILRLLYSQLIPYPLKAIKSK